MGEGGSGVGATLHDCRGEQPQKLQGEDPQSTAADLQQK